MADEKDKQTENNNQADNSEETSASRVGQLNEQQNQARIEQEQQAEKDKEEKKKNDIKPNALNKATGGLLKAAWENLVESWGFTLIWIDIHVFGNLVFGNKVFCKLGSEWIPDTVKQAQFKEGEKLGKVAGTFEGAGVACLNLGCLFTVLAFLMMIGVILEVVSNPISGLYHIFGYIWKSASDAIVKFVSGG